MSDQRRKKKERPLFIEDGGERYVHIGGPNYMHVPKGQTDADVLAKMQRLAEDHDDFRAGRPTRHGSTFMKRQRRSQS